MRKQKRNSDEILVIKFQNGDKNALTVLVKRWHKLFCDKAYWMVKDKDTAKDIAQDSWTTIIHKIDTLKEPKQFKYWAYRIVLNKSTDWLRLQSKRQNKALEGEEDIQSDEASHFENDRLRQAILQAIKSLPTHQKTVVRLFYIQSYSLKQISDLLGISVGTAKSRLFHAREKLKTILKNNNYEN